VVSTFWVAPYGVTPESHGRQINLPIRCPGQRTVGNRGLKVARQGCALQESEIQKIVHLLASTDMSLIDIAQRTGCSRGAIAAINRRFQVRVYGGYRTRWSLSESFQPKLALE
jgi:hypothetical protein